MSQYQVILTLQDGVKSYVTEGASPSQVAAKVKSEYAGNFTEIQVTPLYEQQGINPDAMNQLMSASGGLMACIIVLAIADYQLRKWLKS